jgi:hypothetical protein
MFIIYLISSLFGLRLSYGQETDFSPEKVSFNIRINGLEYQYRIMSIFVLPGEELELYIKGIRQNSAYSIESADIFLNRVDSLKWRFGAPQKNGLYKITIIRSEPADTAVMNIFVMIPYKELKGEYLNNYRIGKYPSIPLKRLPIYKPPRGFIEVTTANQDVQLTPHFKLRQFLCKQESGFPKYVVLREKLLLKLELILEKVNVNGYRCDTFNILSGYRTPFYNHNIGNVRYSRHLWGGAADIFIDEDPKDDMMDDLNKDGKINWKDAAILYDIIDDMYGHKFYEPFIGGLARYKKTSSHGPFVHVDVRGNRARWGY